jgi:hypothetical protein
MEFLEKFLGTHMNWLIDTFARGHDERHVSHTHNSSRTLGNEGKLSNGYLRENLDEKKRYLRKDTDLQEAIAVKKPQDKKKPQEKGICIFAQKTTTDNTTQWQTFGQIYV